MIHSLKRFFLNCDFQVKIWDWFMSKKNLGRIFFGLRKLLLVWKINFARKINYEILFRQLWKNFWKIFDDFQNFHFSMILQNFTFRNQFLPPRKNNSKIFFRAKKWRTLKNWLIYNLPQTAGGCFTFTHFAPTYGFLKRRKRFSSESNWKVFCGFIE